MPQPTGKARPDAVMTNVSISYRNKAYIADRVFPFVPVENQSDKYYTFPRGAWFRDEAKQRAPGDRARRGGYPISTDNYYASMYAFARAIPDEDRKNNLQAVLQPDIRATNFVTNAIQLRHERMVATTLLTSTNYATNHAIDTNGSWAAGTGNTFIANIFSGIETIRKATGIRPNVLLMDANTLSQLQQEATLLDRIKYTQRAVEIQDLIAALFKLEEVLIGDAIYSTADEMADGTDWSSQNIWEVNATKGSAVLYHRASGPALDEPSTGYTMVWQQRQAVRWREEAEHQDVIEVSQAMDVKMTSNVSGILYFDTIVT